MGWESEDFKLEVLQAVIAKYELEISLESESQTAEIIPFRKE
jgi:hypothetical protein